MPLHPVISAMLKKYECHNEEEYKKALKEIIQEVALLGLSRHGFFDHAAFYGGTALRIAHGLDRFSEDLDFERRSPAEEFEFARYLKGIEDELKTYGLSLKAERKEKNAERSIDSAFLKGNTLEHLLLIEGLYNPRVNKNDSIKIKMEIDLDPPAIASTTEIKYHQRPIPFAFRILDLPSLFSGKLHAVLCRAWKGNRLKGRDYFDYLWYRQNKIVPNYEYLKAKLVQSAHWDEARPLDAKELKALLKQRFRQIDWKLAKKDVLAFVRDPFALEVWSTDFFLSTLRDI